MENKEQLSPEVIYELVAYVGFKRHFDFRGLKATRELSDLSVGDYFNPRLVEGAPGLSAAIVRTKTGKKLIEAAEAANYIQTELIEKGNFYAGGFVQKKYGGIYHILQRRKYGWATPDYHMPLSRPEPLLRKVALHAHE